MPSDIEFTIGAHVRCTDGEVGHLIWVVADRKTSPWVITHLVVERPTGPGSAGSSRWTT